MGAAKEVLTALPEWAAEIPYQVKKMAVKDSFDALFNGLRKFKKTKENFRLSFRSRKDPKQSCYIPSSAIKEAGIYVKLAGKLKYAEQLPELPRDSRLLLESGRWFISVPYRVATTSSDNQGRVVALDPGIRTFLTGFSPGQTFKIAEGDFARIARLGVHLDRLLSKVAKARADQKHRYKAAASKLRWKIKDLIDELHFKSVRFLVDNFDLILLPTFATKQMSARLNRKIKAKSVRSLLGFAFFRFGMRLENAAKLVGKTVLRVNEAYTSKTASWTGEIVKIGSAKQITSQGITLDRDVNGARGIFLRALVDSPSLSSVQQAPNLTTKLQFV